MSNYAKKESFFIVGETCPAVDSAFDDVLNDLRKDVDGYFDHLFHDIERSFDTLNSRVKEQTEKLRNGLIETVKRAIEAEEEIKELKKEKRDLEDRVEELEAELKSFLDSTS